MTRLFQIALAGLCAGLLLVIAAELFVANQEDFRPTEVSTTADTKTFRPLLDMEAAVATILERPLFSPTRDRPEPMPDASIAETSESAPPQLGARLAGVMIRPGVREALFARVGQKPIPVKVGGEIDGWKIATIEPDRVILSSSLGTQTLRPTKAPDVVRAPAARATEIFMGMGPSRSSTTRGTVASTPSARPSPQLSQATPQVEK